MSNRSNCQTSSYTETVARFDVSDVAARYPSAFGKSWRDRREAACLRRFFQKLPDRSRVLDLPCGTGRITPLLAERGFEIVAADSSSQMIAVAEANWLYRQPQFPSPPPVTFEVRGAATTGFDDGEFDAIVCNRLFHHFRESPVRVAVLREMSRICRGPILFSFFESGCVGGWRFRLKHWLRGTVPQDRIPIPFAEMIEDVRRADLCLNAVQRVFRGVSPMCFLEVRSQRTASFRKALTTMSSELRPVPLPQRESIAA